MVRRERIEYFSIQHPPSFVGNKPSTDYMTPSNVGSIFKSLFSLSLTDEWDISKEESLCIF
jgi:hypothetical protein